MTDEASGYNMITYACCGIHATGWRHAREIHHSYGKVVSLGTLHDFPEAFLADHPRHLRLCIGDVDATGLDPKRPGESRPPSLQDVNLALDFLSGSGSALIHCHQGVSRSPALAILVAIKAGASVEEALAGIRSPRVEPNRYILALGEATLGLGGRLLAGWERRQGSLHQ